MPSTDGPPKAPQAAQASHAVSISLGDVFSQSSQVNISFTYQLSLTQSDGSQLLYLQNEIKGPAGQHLAITSTSPAEIPNSFPQFPRLPPELRRKIWKLSFGGPRIFRVAPSLGAWEPCLPFTVNHKPPPSASACRESRQIHQEDGQFLFGSEGVAIKSLWFRPSKDILYWDRTLMGSLHINGQAPFRCNFRAIETLAVNVPGSADVTFMESVFDALIEFPGCIRLLLVMQHGSLPDGDVEFLYIKESDDHTICWYDGEALDWSGLKYMLLEDWDDDRLDGFPQLEAVEAVRRRT